MKELLSFGLFFIGLILLFISINDLSIITLNFYISVGYTAGELLNFPEITFNLKELLTTKNNDNC